MFRQMRRIAQAMSREDIDGVLLRGTSGVLALSGDGGYPYALPISYVYDGEKIYFHSAIIGHKIDAIKNNPKGSFCVIDKDCVVPSKYTTHYRSVIAFGHLKILENEDEKRKTIEKLAIKYSPEESPEKTKDEIEKSWSNFCMIEMSIDHISGKESMALKKNAKKP